LIEVEKWLKIARIEGPVGMGDGVASWSGVEVEVEEALIYLRV